MMPTCDDSPELTRLKMDLWNLRSLLSFDLVSLWDTDFQAVNAVIADIERRRDALKAKGDRP